MVMYLVGLSMLRSYVGNLFTGITTGKILVGLMMVIFQKHRAVRQVLKESNVIRMERMADAIVDNRTRDLWKEVKKIKGRNNVSPVNVDGATNVDDILITFSVKYRNLYNSVPYDNNRMSKFNRKLMRG